MAINSFTFDGINSLDYGLYVSGNQTFNSAEKDYSKVSVPGRNGDLLIFNKRYNNVNLNYDAILFDNYEENAENIRSWLLSADGYCRLEDSYHPNEYRMASFSGPINFDTKLLEAGTTTITFDCKPQRWLKIGEQQVCITPDNNRALRNPTRFESKPLFRVFGSGSFQIGSGAITIDTPGTEYIDIDCDIMDCYEGNTNRNGYVTISKWPTLVPGTNNVVFSIGSNITKICVIPRWWTL